MLPEDRYVCQQQNNASLTSNTQIFAKDLENSRWSILKDMPRDKRSYASSLDCLDLISQTHPGQERLREVSIEMSDRMIMLFMEGLIPQILKRLRALQSVELILEDKEWTPTSCTTIPLKSIKSIRSPSFDRDRDFLLLIKSELAHIKVVTTNHNSVDKGSCPWVAKQLQKRNQAWTAPPPVVNRFIRTTCSMTTLDPMVLKNLSKAEVSCRTKKEPREDEDRKNCHIAEDLPSLFD